MKKPLKISLIAFIVLVVLFSLAYLTKAGYIANYFDILFLEPGYSWIRPGFIKKPIIYLYPTKEQKTLVQLDYNGTLIADYPDYNYSIKGWEVIAYPDGRLINLADNKEYSYLFWEGTNSNIKYDLSTGFVIKGGDTRMFLQNTLEKIGLTPKEYNEFIVYWYPIMKNNKYNLIYFAREEYTNSARLNIIPKPDSILRVFMVFKPLHEAILINAQKIEPFERKGFTVIEWGGAELK